MGDLCPTMALTQHSKTFLKRKWWVWKIDLDLDLCSVVEERKTTQVGPHIHFLIWMTLLQNVDAPSTEAWSVRSMCISNCCSSRKEGKVYFAVFTCFNIEQMLLVASWMGRGEVLVEWRIAGGDDEEVKKSCLFLNDKVDMFQTESSAALLISDCRQLERKGKALLQGQRSHFCGRKFLVKTLTRCFFSFVWSAQNCSAVSTTTTTTTNNNNNNNNNNNKKHELLANPQCQCWRSKPENHRMWRSAAK